MYELCETPARENSAFSFLAAAQRSVSFRLVLSLLMAALLCVFHEPVKADVSTNYEAGRSAFRQGNFAEAERIWRQLAEQGDGQSQFFLGVLYDQGPEPIGKDDTKAFHWFEKAASQGHVNGQFNLGNAYMNGRGVAQDYVQAVHWWRQAADSGSPSAQFNLAIQYYQGRGVEKDWDKAVEYFNRAAGNGHVKAMELITSNQVPNLQITGAVAGEQTVDAEEIVAVAEEHPVTPPAEEASVADAQEFAGEDSVAEPVFSGDASVAEQDHSAVDWLRNQDPGFFTVQLAVSGSMDGIDRLVARHGLANDTVRVPVQRDGKTLYYLLMGSFSERRQAILRIESLAADLRASKPWPRPFSELQSLAEHGG